MLEPFVRGFPVPVQTFLRSGFWAVGTFFVLSGFVLARGYAATRWGRASLIRYGAARLARIYPVYLLSLVIIAPIVYEDLFSATQSRITEGKAFLITNYSLLLQGWTGTLPVNWNTPAWSLSCELFFYLCFPLVLLVLRPNRWLGAVVSATAALSLPLLLPAMGLPDRWKPLMHLGDFLLGIGLAGLFETLMRRRPGLAGSGHWFYLPAAFVAVIAVSAPDLVGRWAPVDLLLRPLNALLIFGLALGGGWLARALSTPVSVLLGKASYALYILHIPVLIWYKRSWVYRLTSPWPTSAALIYIASAVVVSALVFKLFEEPANRYLRRALVQRLVPQPAPPKLSA